jgi:hypothetical protein
VSIFKKRKQKQRNAPDVRLAKKLLGKDSGRKVWGFPCSPDIPARMKVLAGRLNVPIYGLTEHALQITAPLMAKMADNPEQFELLRRHLVEGHVERRTIEKISQVDEDMANILDAELGRRLKMDQAARQIVLNCISRGIEPQQIMWAIDYGLKCRLAVAQGRPMPQDRPPEV